MPEPAASEPPSPRQSLDDLNDIQLAAEKTRSEVRKLQIEMQELRSWRGKLIFTSFMAVLAPLGSVILFLVGWYGSHASDRRHQNEDLFTRAAKELASPDASVRLSAVTTLDRFVKPDETTAFGSISEWLFTSRTSKDLAKDRAGEAMALLIGSLSRENDPGVLNAIAQDVVDNPEASALPLISMNKNAAVLFARAAGRYSGLSILRIQRAKSFSVDDWRKITTRSGSDPTIDDIVVVVLRTGSPFEATAQLNQRFSSRNFLTTNKCPFRELFTNQQMLSMGSDLHDISRSQPADAKEIEQSLSRVMDSAATLERSSYILGKLAAERWYALKGENLYGTAVVVGDFDANVVTHLRSRAGYFNANGDAGPNPGCDVQAALRISASALSR
jgi:hypothetical protein